MSENLESNLWYPQFSQKTNGKMKKMKKIDLTILCRGVNEEGAGGAIATPFFGRLKGAGGVAPNY